MNGGLGKLMQQAQQMQARLAEVQAEIAALEITGEAGGGMVRVTLNGDHDARRVEISPAAFSDDREMLEDLVTAAINDASQKVDAARKEKMAGVTGGMGLPPGFNLPI